MPDTTRVGLTGLDGKVAIVTGAGRMRSIGRSMAVELARAGCDVVVTGTGRAPATYPDDEKEAGWRDIESTADEVRALGRRALAVVSDVADLGAVERLAEQVLAEMGKVDIVVNNAGAALGADRVPVVELAGDEWRRVIDVNLTGTFYMCRTFARHMVERGEGGSIVNISSSAGKSPMPKMAAYSASKAGIHALTVSMAQELARDGVRVNVVCPGLVDTHRHDAARKRWDTIVERTVALGRAGTGEDIAWMVLYLCSDQGSWITGQVYAVDGGSLPGW